MSILFSGFGSCIPHQKVDDSSFILSEFYNKDGSEMDLPNSAIIQKFKEITGIQERRYAQDNQVASDLGYLAAQNALSDSGIDKENLLGIICATNYGDIPLGTSQSDTVPSLASRIKHHLRIKNPDCMAFDVAAGCPGWIQGVIIADRFLKAVDKGYFLVVAAETLSRVTDPHDRDSMIYADGAGAVILEKNSLPDNRDSGILSTASQSFTQEEVNFLNFGHSYNHGYEGRERRFIKMQGRKIYEFALKNVPLAMKNCLEKAGLEIKDLNKVLLHQANEKMDIAILQRFFKLYKLKEIPEDILPMSIGLLGNSSVATIPTLMDLIIKGKMDKHSFKKGDLLLLASVGAGMNINAIAYRI